MTAEIRISRHLVDEVQADLRRSHPFAHERVGFLSCRTAALVGDGVLLIPVAYHPLADHEYVDKIINTLPDQYRALGRQGMYGDFFSFYLCDVVLKLNGKGGQPVYVKVAGQSTGRCAPK